MCLVGKWINGIAKDKYGHIGIFSELKANHALFHIAAGNVIRQIDKGLLTEASESIHRGEYLRYSVMTQRLLGNLYDEVSSQLANEKLAAKRAALIRLV